MVKRQPNDDDFYITDMYSQLAVCSNLLASSEKSLPKENQSLLNEINVFFQNADFPRDFDTFHDPRTPVGSTRHV